MYTFEDIGIGDLFNTRAGRWVKTSDTQGLCVMSTMLTVGSVHPFLGHQEILLLWSALLKTDKEIKETQSVTPFLDHEGKQRTIEFDKHKLKAYQAENGAVFFTEEQPNFHPIFGGYLE